MEASRCAVLGRPIAHSLSPLLHRAAYRETGLDWSYEAYDVGAEDLAGFLAGLDGSWRGLSLTMPLKRVVLPLLDSVEEVARRAGAANTVLLGAGRRVGANTDVPGAVAAIRERHPGPVGRALLLGGGATAASVLLALADLGCREARLLVREPARAADTVQAVGRHPRPPEVSVEVLGTPSGGGWDIVVSTLPATAQTPELADLASVAPVVFDVGYDPWPTPFAVRAAADGRVVVSGLDLLVHQAAVQFRLMTGLPAPVAAMRAAGEAALAARPPA